jgi:hypothetical protein
MNARDEARAALDRVMVLDEALQIVVRDNHTSVLTPYEVELRTALRALLDEPVPADEREALADIIDDTLQSLSDTSGACYKVSDAVLAAGFRRQGPITDAQVRAVAEALESMHWDGMGCGTHGTNACSNCHGPSPMSATELARAALEAAEAAR